MDPATSDRDTSIRLAISSSWVGMFLDQENDLEDLRLTMEKQTKENFVTSLAICMNNRASLSDPAVAGEDLQ